MPSVLVLGATGKQGGGVIDACLNHGLNTWAMCRNQDSPKAQALMKKGVNLIQGNFAEEADLQRAIETSNANAMYLVSIEQMSMLPWQAGKYKKSEIKTGKMVIDVAERSKIEYIVMSSVSGADSSFAKSHLPNFQAKAELEAYLKTKSMKFTILRPVNLFESFLDPSLGSLDEQNKTVIGMPYEKNLKIWWISCRDLGRIAAFCFNSFLSTEKVDEEIEVIGQTLTCASTKVSALEITSSYGRVKHIENPAYKPIAPKWMLKLGVLPDFGRMQQMWKQTGYPVSQSDLELLNRIAPEMYDAEAFFRSIEV